MLDLARYTFRPGREQPARAVQEWSNALHITPAVGRRLPRVRVSSILGMCKWLPGSLVPDAQGSSREIYAGEKP